MVTGCNKEWNIGVWESGHSKVMSTGRRTQELMSERNRNRNRNWNYTLDRDIKGGI